jgi:sugar lactone lactonase YvrE
MSRLSFALVLVAVPAFAQEKPVAQPPAAPAASKPIILGEGKHRYEWQSGWGRLPDNKELGNTHGAMVIDDKGRLLANSDVSAMLVFGADGKVASSWGNEYRGGLHGMCRRVENGKEVLYLVHTSRHEALKASIDGKVEWTIGWPQASGIYEKEEQFNPTSIAVADDGRIFVADGYGKSWVHIYDKDRKYMKSFGGPGSEPGKMATCHGLLLDKRGKEPLLLVCDRENGRLEWFDLDGKFVRLMDKDEKGVKVLRRPCNVWPLDGGELAIADLCGRVTLLDKNDKLIVHLGDNPEEALRCQNGVPRDKWQDGFFLSPHSVCADKEGNLYVMDWNFLGRITKLKKLS